MPEQIAQFRLHPQLQRDSVPVCKLDLCEVRMINDATYPWLLLVPQMDGVREIHQLTVKQQQTLMQEMTQVSRMLERITGADKMNVAALGNMVPQLHVHIIARFEGDPAWPGPVWGVQPAAPYGKSRLDALIQDIKAALKANK